MELGQLLLSNTPPQEYEAEWATDGLHLIAQVIAELRGKDPNGGWTTLTSNSGEEDFENDVFFMSSYCWCDGDRHPEGCPPNFIYKPNGLVVSWYKHAGRGIRANMEYPGAKNWFKAISKCIESIGKKPYVDCPHMFVTTENKAKGICGICGISFDEWHG
mgnify:CR=1 FL=1